MALNVHMSQLPHILPGFQRLAGYVTVNRNALFSIICMTFVALQWILKKLEFSFNLVITVHISHFNDFSFNFQRILFS